MHVCGANGLDNDGRNDLGEIKKLQDLHGMPGQVGDKQLLRKQ